MMDPATNRQIMMDDDEEGYIQTYLICHALAGMT